MKLVFKDIKQINNIIAEVKNESEALKEIKKYCENNNYQIAFIYIDTSYRSDVIIYDIGNSNGLFYLYLNNEV